MISIITVVKNGVETIENTILSVIGQDYQNYEYIIIDGISNDGTIELIEKYSSYITFVSEQDNGIYDAMNKGISLAKGDWVYFLGSDDVLYDKSILTRIFLRTDYDAFNIIYGNVLFLNTKRIYDGKFDYEKLCNRSICQQSIFYRKILFEKYGRFNTEYVVAADNVFNQFYFCTDTEKWKYVDHIIAIFNENATSGNIKDEKYLDNSFSIRYNNFRPFVSKLVLARIFWSSFYRYFISHKISDTIKYASLLKQDIGFMKLIVYLPIITLYKLRNKF